MMSNNQIEITRTKGNLDEKTPVIQKTYDYDKFRFLKENRPINKHKVEKIMGSIKEDDQTPFRPILVNKDYGVIDGQHQFTAQKNLGMPIYYVQNPYAKLRSVTLLNAYTTSWGTVDYAHFYAKQGDNEYKKLLAFAEKNHVSISLASGMLTMTFHGMGQLRNNFKNGKFTITHEEEANILLDEINQLRPHLKEGVEKDREFYRSYTIMRNIVDFDIFKDTLEKKHLDVQLQATKRDYLREFERILNYEKKSNTFRLF